MEKWLNLSEKEKLEILNFSTYGIGLPDYVIEKDIWVTESLRKVFDTSFASHMIFKGGTSLSKAWGVIYRFSEDIDLAIDYGYLGFKDELTRTQVNNLRKAAQVFVKDLFYPELVQKFEGYPLKIHLEETTNSTHDPMKIFIEYQPLTKHTQYVLPKVTLEIGGRSLQEPFSVRSIQSIIKEGYPNFEYIEGDPFSVSTANVELTFLEKLFLLHETFQGPIQNITVERMSRHLYDIVQINKTEFAKNAINDQDLYRSIANHRKIFYRIGSINYDTLFPPTLNPLPPKDQIEAWESDYKDTCEQMIVGNPPSFKDLISEIEEITRTINQLTFEHGQ